MHAMMNARQTKTHAADNMDRFQRILSNDEIRMSSERTSASKKVSDCLLEMYPFRFNY